MSTIYELLEVAARPVLAAAPQRISADAFYHPDFTDDEVRSLGPLSDDPADLPAEVERHAALADMLVNTPFGDKGELNAVGMQLFSLFLRGSVRAVLTGVFAQAPGKADIRCYADGQSALLWSVRPDGGVEFCVDDFAELPRLILEYLPDAPDGVLEPIRLSADGRGVIAEGQDDKVCAVEDFLERARTGTTVVDLIAFGGLCSEYPEHGMVIIDNDLGRHMLGTLSHGKSRRELVLVRSGNRVLTTWLRKCVEAGRSGF